MSLIIIELFSWLCAQIWMNTILVCWCTFGLAMLITKIYSSRHLIRYWIGNVGPQMVMIIQNILITVYLPLDLNQEMELFRKSLNESVHFHTNRPALKFKNIQISRNKPKNRKRRERRRVQTDPEPTEGDVSEAVGRVLAQLREEYHDELGNMAQGTNMAEAIEFVDREIAQMEAWIAEEKEIQKEHEPVGVDNMSDEKVAAVEESEGVGDVLAQMEAGIYDFKIDGEVITDSPGNSCGDADRELVGAPEELIDVFPQADFEKQGVMGTDQELQIALPGASSETTDRDRLLCSRQERLDNAEQCSHGEGDPEEQAGARDNDDSRNPGVTQESRGKRIRQRLRKIFCCCGSSN